MNKLMENVAIKDGILNIIFGHLNPDREPLAMPEISVQDELAQPSGLLW